MKKMRRAFCRLPFAAMLERAAHGWSAWTVHAVLMAMQLAQLGLLVWRESLIESSLGLWVPRDHLRGQVPDGGRILINGCRVILLDGRLQRLMRGSHLLMQRLG